MVLAGVGVDGRLATHLAASTEVRWALLAQVREEMVITPLVAES